MTLMLQLTNLEIRAGDKRLLSPMSFSLYENRPLTILGQTGSGKSLLAQAIMGLLPKGLTATGDIQLFGQSHDKVDLPSLWGRQMIMLPQEPWNALDPLMPGYKQVSEVHHLVAGKSEMAAFEAALADLDHMGLTESAGKRPGQLSGGMAQRLAIAAASAGGAPLMLADEPTKGLDVSRRDDVITLLKERSLTGGLLTITHDVEVARQLGGDVMVICEGELVEQGVMEEVFANPSHEYTRSLIEAEPKHWDMVKETPEAPEPVLQVENLSIARGRNTLFKDLSFTLGKGEILGVVGDSGSGKSSLGDALLGLLKPAAGSITRLAEEASPHKWLKLYQDPPSAFTHSVTLQRLLDDLVDLHNIDRSRIAPLMKRLKIRPELLSRYSYSVSGGELQRFAILRALLLSPVFLFADEPTSRLDPITAREVTELLVQVAREDHCALLLVSHDPDMIDRVCDWVITLN